ncbi:MAG TPA: gamma-glutamyltransferase family protein [Rhizomicrobium sp.]|nr:gamma-glutamyltransferase family protein [Rhizomicrobium sp.]
MNRVRFSIRLVLALVASGAVVVGLVALVGFPQRDAEAITAHRHIAVTANPFASRAAREILRQGGSAVDAAITAQLVLTLVEPQSSGIGGGLYLLVFDPSMGLRVFDGREVAPAAATPQMFLGADGKVRSFDDVATGGLAVGVPGALAALAMAHQRFGKLPWVSLLAPAIKLAEKGFEVSPLLGAAIAELDPLALGAGMRAAYFHPNGRPFEAGETLRDREFARTLRVVAARGISGFYQGEVAEKIVAAVRSDRRNPGSMTLADLASYRVRESDALCRPYRDFRVCTTPAPSGGVALQQILGLLGSRRSDELRYGSLSQIHLLTQVERLAYADRAHWQGDPAFVPVPLEGLLDTSYLRARAELIHPRRDMGVAIAGTPPSQGRLLRDFAPQRTPVFHGTSHLSVVDDAGQVVSMTMSIQASFGSQLRAGGFVLNNELTDFSLEPEIDGRPVANAPAPGKRPLSAMSPSIVFDAQGRFFAAIGSPGGPEIISYNAQALVNLLDSHESVATTVSAPHAANINGVTVLEAGTSMTLSAPWLFVMGHPLRFRSLESGLNGIRRIPNGYEAASDVRGDGAAAGD